MESELERFNKQNTQLELSIKELTQKLKATDKEMHQERQKVRISCFIHDHKKLQLNIFNNNNNMLITSNAIVM